MRIVSLAGAAAAAAQQAPWWVYGVVLGGLGLLVLLFIGMDHLERRGLIRWNRAYTARAAPAILELQQMLEPRTQYVQAVRRGRKARGDASGDPPSGPDADMVQ